MRLRVRIKPPKHARGCVRTWVREVVAAALTASSSMKTPCSRLCSYRSGEKGRPTFSVRAPPGAEALVVIHTDFASQVYFTCRRGIQVTVQPARRIPTGKSAADKQQQMGLSRARHQVLATSSEWHHLYSPHGSERRQNRGEQYSKEIHKY